MFIVVGMCPEYLRTIVEPATPSHPGLRSAACSAWNSLPADIRCTTNRQTFKTLLKSHFIRQAFDIS